MADVYKKGERVFWRIKETYDKRPDEFGIAVRDSWGTGVVLQDSEPDGYVAVLRDGHPEDKGQAFCYPTYMLYRGHELKCDYVKPVISRADIQAAEAFACALITAIMRKEKEEKDG